MTRLYSYINNVHNRYGVDFNTILVSLVWDNEIDKEDIKQAMKAMEFSIVQSLRKVDIMTRISDSQYLIVLTGSVYDNV